MKDRTKFLIVVVAFLFIMAGCGTVEERPSPDSRPPAAMPTPTPAPFLAPQSGALFIVNGASVTIFKDGVASQPADRLIVRNVSVSMLGDDISATLEAISAVASGVGGFVVSTQLSGEEESRLGFVTICVPEDQLSNVLNRIRGMAVRVLTEHSSAQDVTEEHVGLDARVRNLEKAERQFLGIMERAETVEDTLKVQRELTSVQGQLEQLKGRMQYLERTSATSLISVELRPASSPLLLVEPGWRPVETAKDAVRGLSSFGQGLADVAIRVRVFAPGWLPVLVAGWWLLRRDLRVRRWASGGRTPTPRQESGLRQ